MGEGQPGRPSPRRHWIGGDRMWSPIQCLTLSPPSLSLFCPPPACLASCSPATCQPYFFIVMCWWVSPLKMIDTTYPWRIFVLGPIPSNFFYSVTKAFLRYNLSSRQDISPKNCTSVSWFFLWQNGLRGEYQINSLCVAWLPVLQ